MLLLLPLDPERRLRLVGVLDRDVRLTGVLERDVRLAGVLERDVRVGVLDLLLLGGVLDLVFRFLVGVIDSLLLWLADGDLFRSFPVFLTAGGSAILPLWAAVSSSLVATTVSLPLWAAVPSFLTWGSVTWE